VPALAATIRRHSASPKPQHGKTLCCGFILSAESQAAAMKKPQRFLQNETAASNLLNIRVFSFIETTLSGLLSITRLF